MSKFRPISKLPRVGGSSLPRAAEDIRTFVGERRWEGISLPWLTQQQYHNFLQRGFSQKRNPNEGLQCTHRWTHANARVCMCGCAPACDRVVRLQCKKHRGLIELDTMALVRPMEDSKPQLSHGASLVIVLFWWGACFWGRAAAAPANLCCVPAYG